MTFYQRRLPHIHEVGRPIFLTWRLNGSLPAGRGFPRSSMTSGQAFAAMDRLLDGAASGPVHLGQAHLADMMTDAIRYNAQTLRQYDVHAYVVMPNHVHVLLTPLVEVARLTMSLKGITARRANRMLGLQGEPFWQEESYDHLVRDDDEFRRIVRYVEANPVRAGLVAEKEGYRWSSAYAGRAVDSGS